MFIFYGVLCMIAGNIGQSFAGSVQLPRPYPGPVVRPIGQFCSITSPCPAKQCCRNAQGSLTGGSGEAIEPIDFDQGNGTCSFRPSGPNEVCVDSCGCIRGYECYRTVTGFCCPPKTCWKKEDARRDREYWANCRPPTCFFPPAANPGSGR